MKSHYQTLGVHKGSTSDEVRTAFMALAKRYHPDVVSPRLPGRAAKHVDFAEITEAYAELGDRKRRSLYDTALAMVLDPCPGCGGRGFTVKTKGFGAQTRVVCPKCRGNGGVERKR